VKRTIVKKSRPFLCKFFENCKKKKKKPLNSQRRALDGSTSQIFLSILYNEQSYETHGCVMGVWMVFCNNAPVRHGY